MIGDRINTDVLFGKVSGIDTLLVLSGASQKTDMATSDIKPTYYTNSIADLCPKN